MNWIGKAELIPFGIPNQDQSAILGVVPQFQTLHPQRIHPYLPLNRPIAVHKYQMGAALLICGSKQYPGAAIIAAQAARASGVGMLYVAVPQSLAKNIITAVPDAVIVSCPETEEGAISALPKDFDLNRINAIAIGPGLSIQAISVVEQMLQQSLPLVLDADALNILSQLNPIKSLAQRQAATVLTPHWGEFKRLFETLVNPDDLQTGDRLSIFAKLKDRIPATVALKGATTLISANKAIIANRDSTPALARGGSGDVLTGLLVGLWAQQPTTAPTEISAAAVWWHAQTALWAERKVTCAGVSPTVLIENLIPFLVHHAQKEKQV